jgi:hypothetical protein
MIAIEMAIRVRVCFLKVYTSFVIYNPLEIRGRVKTHQSRISEKRRLQWLYAHRTQDNVLTTIRRAWIGQNHITLSFSKMRLLIIRTNIVA